MPALSPQIAVALDMGGCPNRCRHCWLGAWPSERMSHGDLRWTVGRFRRWARPGEDEPFFKRITAFSWWREPDYRPDYRELCELERELSDGQPTRVELLSVWRLARDKGYASWAKSVGTEACQITFFGLQESHDWFVRRKGSFHDSLLATERLLEAGIQPRW